MMRAVAMRRRGEHVSIVRAQRDGAEEALPCPANAGWPHVEEALRVHRDEQTFRSAHSVSPWKRRPIVKILRPSTRSTRPSMRNSVQRRRLAVVDRQPTRHARASRQRLSETEHLVEHGGDDTTVHISGRALVLIAEHSCREDAVVDHVDVQRRSKRVQRTDEGADEHRRVRITGDRCLGALVLAPVRQAGEESAGCGDEPGRFADRVGIGNRRERLADEPSSRIGQLEADQVVRRRDLFRCDERFAQAGRDVVGEIAHTAASARSTTTGAWSDGCWPLRALRSMIVHSTRPATDGVASTRSIRKPRPW